VADLGKTVQEFAPAPTMAPVTPLIDPVSATRVGLAVTVLNVSLAGEQQQNHSCLFVFKNLKI
jgi:hypothetical protein